ncbi:MAG: FecR domain-containing protein, partial [Pseudomonadota bacterium]
MMILNRFVRALVLIGLLLPVGVPAALASESPAGWQVLESLGGVHYRKPSGRSWWRAQTGDEIPAGSVVATSSSGFLIISRSGESMTLRPNSRIELPGALRAGQVRQSAGDLRYRITSDPDRRFTVETPYLSLLVKGTVFDVVVGDNGAKVGVSRGRVQVDTERGQAVELSTGQSARIARDDAVLEVQSAPDRPFAAIAAPPNPVTPAPDAEESDQFTTREGSARTERLAQAPADRERSVGSEQASHATVARTARAPRPTPTAAEARRAERMATRVFGHDEGRTARSDARDDADEVETSDAGLGGFADDDDHRGPGVREADQELPAGSSPMTRDDVAEMGLPLPLDRPIGDAGEQDSPGQNPALHEGDL